MGGQRFKSSRGASWVAAKGLRDVLCPLGLVIVFLWGCECCFFPSIVSAASMTKMLGGKSSKKKSATPEKKIDDTDDSVQENKKNKNSQNTQKGHTSQAGSKSKADDNPHSDAQNKKKPKKKKNNFGKSLKKLSKSAFKMAKGLGLNKLLGTLLKTGMGLFKKKKKSHPAPPPPPPPEAGYDPYNQVGLPPVTYDLPKQRDFLAGLPFVMFRPQEGAPNEIKLAEDQTPGDS